MWLSGKKHSKLATELNETEIGLSGLCNDDTFETMHLHLKQGYQEIEVIDDDFDCTMERHLFGCRHGKGPSDGECAVVKSHATRAVKASFIKLRQVSFYAKVLAVGSTGEMKVHYLTKLHDSNLYVWSDEARLPADHPFVVGPRQTHRFPDLIF